MRKGRLAERMRENRNAKMNTKSDEMGMHKLASSLLKSLIQRRIRSRSDVKITWKERYNAFIEISPDVERESITKLIGDLRSKTGPSRPIGVLDTTDENNLYVEFRPRFLIQQYNRMNR